MDKELKKIIESMREIKLSPQEKSHMHRELLSTIQKYPAKQSQRFHSSLASLRLNIFSKPASLALIAVATLGMGSGISIAAENTLPGDILYPVKVGITEPARGLLAYTPRSKAEWETRLVGRRLEETEKLLTQDNINPNAIKNAQDQIEKSMETAKTRLANLRQRGDLGEESEVNAHFEASLLAHKKVLEKLEENTPTSGTVPSLSNNIKKRIEHIAERRIAIESEMTKNEKNVASEATKNLAKAQTTIREARAIIEAEENEFDAESREDAQIQLDAMDTLVQEGENKVTSKAHGEALLLFQKADRAAEEVKQIVRARRDLKINVSLDGTATTSRKNRNREEGKQEDKRSREKNSASDNQTESSD